MDKSPENTKMAAKRDALIVQCMSWLNEALSEYIDEHCGTHLNDKYQNAPKKVRLALSLFSSPLHYR